MINTLVILWVVCIILLIWAIVSTWYAIKNNKRSIQCEQNLRVAESGLDTCYSFCGSKGNWASGQKSHLADTINMFLPHQTSIVCGNSGVSYPKLSTCAVDSIANDYKYWAVSNPNDVVGTISIVSTALGKCVQSVPDCKTKV